MEKFHIIRTSDNYYTGTITGTREDADTAAANYATLCGGRTPAYVLPAEPDYPATIAARKMHGDKYADYIQGNLHVKATLSADRDRRAESLGAILANNNGE